MSALLDAMARHYTRHPYLTLLIATFVMVALPIGIIDALVIMVAS